MKALSVDLDGTLYPVHRLRVAWRLRGHLRLLRAFVAARERLRRERPEDLRAREVELVAAEPHRLERFRALLPGALTRGVAPHRGVVEALERARVAGMKLAVLSDFDPGEKLRHLGLDRIGWHAVVAAETTGALKPDPRGFLEVARRLRIAPGKMVHIGDREDADVQGALAAGMRAWRFSPKGPVPSAAERVFSRWTEIAF